MKLGYFFVLILFKMFCLVKRYDIFGFFVEVFKEVSCYGDYEEKKFKNMINLCK